MWEFAGGGNVGPWIRAQHGLTVAGACRPPPLAAPVCLAPPARVAPGMVGLHPALLHLIQRTSAARAEGVELGVQLGRARGRLLGLAEVRGLALTPDQAARVEAETDVALLQRWADRTRVAASAAEVFAEG
jgi:hypothetical protein